MAKNKKNYFGMKNLILVGVLVIAVVAIGIFSSYSTNPATQSYVTSTALPASKGNCGDLQVDINSMEEASGIYNKFGDLKPAVTNLKFEVLDLTISNQAISTQEFSGYRILLQAGNSSYIPVQFSEISKIALTDNSAVDYICSELNISSISRFVLGPGQSSRGCKIYQILQGQIPKSLSIYNQDILKCTVPV